MALVKCGECGEQISDKAAACPKCGAPATKPKAPPAKTSGCAMVVLASILALAFGSILTTMSGSGQKSTAAPSANDQRNKEEAWIDAGKDSVRAKLKDGGSAEFRNVFFSQKGGVPVSCGEVNSKNSFGAFGGFQRYIATNSPATTYIEEQVQGFEKSWQQFCK